MVKSQSKGVFLKALLHVHAFSLTHIHRSMAMLHMLPYVLPCDQHRGRLTCPLTDSDTQNSQPPEDAAWILWVCVTTPACLSILYQEFALSPPRD